MPRFYPMMMDIKGRNCLVVGGGDVAARKAEMLVKCGASVKIVAPELDASLAPLVDDGRITHLKEEYDPRHLEGISLAIGATDSGEVNRKLYDDASEKGLPVNIVDVPELCSFIVPSIVEQGDLLIAISTSGKSPAMSKRIRKELQKTFGAEYAKMLRLMGEMREILTGLEPDYKKRMAIFTKIANSDLLERIRKGENPNPDDLVKEALDG